MMTFDDVTFLSVVLNTYNNMSAWKPGETIGWICALEQMVVQQHTGSSDECVDLMFKIMGRLRGRLLVLSKSGQCHGQDSMEHIAVEAWGCLTPSQSSPW
eukprot:1345899-Amphidinium_carterae.1